MDHHKYKLQPEVKYYICCPLRSTKQYYYKAKSRV